MTATAERGHLLPVSTTHAAVAALAHAPDLEADLFPLVASRRYEPPRGPPSTRRTAPRSRSPCRSGGQASSARPSRTRARSRGRRPRANHGGKCSSQRPARTWRSSSPTRREGPPAPSSRARAGEPRRRQDRRPRRGGRIRLTAIGRVTFDNATAASWASPAAGLQVLRDVSHAHSLDLRSDRRRGDGAPPWLRAHPPRPIPPELRAAGWRPTPSTPAHFRRHRPSRARRTRPSPCGSPAPSTTPSSGTATTPSPASSPRPPASTPLKAAPAVALEACESMGAAAFRRLPPGRPHRGRLRGLLQWNGTASVGRRSLEPPPRWRGTAAPSPTARMNLPRTSAPNEDHVEDGRRSRREARRRRRARPAPSPKSRHGGRKPSPAIRNSSAPSRRLRRPPLRNRPAPRYGAQPDARLRRCTFSYLLLF